MHYWIQFIYSSQITLILVSPKFSTSVVVTRYFPQYMILFQFFFTKNHSHLSYIFQWKWISKNWLEAPSFSKNTGVPQILPVNVSCSLVTLFPMLLNIFPYFGLFTGNSHGIGPVEEICNHKTQFACSNHKIFNCY